MPHSELDKENLHTQKQKPYANLVNSMSNMWITISIWWAIMQNKHLFPTGIIPLPLVEIIKYAFLCMKKHNMYIKVTVKHAVTATTNGAKIMNRIWPSNWLSANTRISKYTLMFNCSSLCNNKGFMCPNIVFADTNQLWQWTTQFC